MWVSLTQISLVRMKTRKLGSHFWRDEWMTKQRGMRGKRTYWMPGFRRDCSEILMSREQRDLEKPCQSLLRERESNTWETPKRKMIKEEWQLPADLDEVWCRISNKATGKQCVLLSSFERLYISSSFLAGWGRAPTIIGYPEATREKWGRKALKNEHGPRCDVVAIETTLNGSQEGQCLSSEQLTSY